MFKLGAVLFDVYGTLFDLSSAVAPHARKLRDRGDPISALWRQKQLEYAWTETIRGVYRPFDEITRQALEFALERELHSPEQALVTALMKSFARLKPIADVNRVFETLKARGLRLGILSNGTPKMLETLVEGHSFAAYLDPDLILSVDTVKAYKPDRRVYQPGADALELPNDEIGFVSANAWDAAGAAAFGFDAYWISQLPYEQGLRRKVHDIEGIYALPDALP